MRIRAMLFLGFTLLCTALHSQRFYAQTNGQKIVEGSYVQVDFILENADGSNFKPPPFTGMKVVSGPSSSTSTTIVNGEMNKTFKISYGIQFDKRGKYTIGSASVRAYGKALKTKPIAIEVVKGNDNNLSLDKQVFVKTEISDTTTYVGQQLILNYKLYTTLDVRQWEFKTNPDYDGFYVEEQRLGKINYSKQVIAGVEYFVRPIKKLILFPQQTGTYKIPAAPINLGIAKAGSKRSFFFSSQLVPKQITSDGVTIKVNALPYSDQPATGAVGRYRFNANLAKRTLTTDDAIEIQVEIHGNGDSKTVSAPRWALPEGLEMYDPNTLDDQVYNTQQGRNHKKVFEYLIVAKKPGKYTLEPSFTYFDTDRNDYVTLRKRLGPINVLQGNNVATVAPAAERQKLADIYTTTKLTTAQISPYHSLLHLLGLGIIGLGALGIFGYGYRLQKSGKLDAVTIKRNKAKEVAQARLKGSKSFLDQEDSKGFHQEMILALKTYISDKYNIPALHIKKAELISQLQSTNITAEQVNEFKAILDASEIAMYAPGQSGQLSEAYNKALDLITGLE